VATRIGERLRKFLETTYVLNEVNADLIERRVEAPEVREFAEGIKSEGNRVAEIARDHGGDLAVESEERRYARFHLDLHAETE
jgi:hypothetical protein